MKADERFDPMTIGLFSANTVVLGTNGIAHLSH